MRNPSPMAAAVTTARRTSVVPEGKGTVLRKTSQRAEASAAPTTGYHFSTQRGTLVSIPDRDRLDILSVGVPGGNHCVEASFLSDSFVIV